MKKLIDYNLGEIIDTSDALSYFGKEISELLVGKLKLVGISWTIQDDDETQMDYVLKHKDYIEKKEAEEKEA